MASSAIHLAGFKIISYYSVSLAKFINHGDIVVYLVELGRKKKAGDRYSVNGVSIE